MRKKWHFLDFLLFISGLFIITQSYGQKVSSGPDLTIEVDQQDIQVTGPCDIYVTFSNVSNIDLKIERAELIYPAAVKSTRDTLPTNLLRNNQATSANFEVIPKGSRRFFHCIFPRYEKSWLDQLLDISTFFFLPGKYRIQAVIDYSPVSDDTILSGVERPHRRFLRQTAVVELKPPLVTQLRGGWIGCLLAALFITIRWSGNYRTEDAKKREWYRINWQVVKFGFRVLITGLVSATIIILLLQRLSDIGLPLTVEVNDWIGGVIVGLVSYASTEALYRRLTGGGDTNPKNRTPSAQDRNTSVKDECTT